MDYKKSGAAKPAKGAPKFDPHSASPKGKGGSRPQSGKEALIARMKAAAEKRKG